MEPVRSPRPKLAPVSLRGVAGIKGVWLRPDHMRGKKYVTSRLSFQLTYGDIPAGLSVCHYCDAPACLEPRHLWLGTQKDNLMDCSEKGRTAPQAHPERRARGDRHGSRTHPELIPRGEMSGRAKLTEDQVREIRSADGTLAALAVGYGVGMSTIWRIGRGKAWLHVA
jgi:hypothetical protein